MSKIEFINGNSIIELHQAYKHIESLSKSYPDFYDWYWNKVIPGINNGINELIMGLFKNELVGISIIKKGEEKKLCALRVTDKFKNRGYGLHMLDESLKRLEIDKPLCSVSEEMINDYSRIFVNRYDFDLSHVYKGLYRKGKLEYEFNGGKTLTEKTLYGL